MEFLVVTQGFDSQKRGNPKLSRSPERMAQDTRLPGYQGDIQVSCLCPPGHTRWVQAKYPMSPLGQAQGLLVGTIASMGRPQPPLQPCPFFPGAASTSS